MRWHVMPCESGWSVPCDALRKPVVAYLPIVFFQRACKNQSSTLELCRILHRTCIHLTFSSTNHHWNQTMYYRLRAFYGCQFYIPIRLGARPWPCSRCHVICASFTRLHLKFLRSDSRIFNNISVVNVMLLSLWHIFVINTPKMPS